MAEIFTKIQKILTSRDLKAKVPVDEKALVDDQRFLVIPCQDKQGKEWLLKIQALQIGDLGESFRNEVQFLSFAQKTEIASFVPKLLDAGEVSGKVWYLREFVDGQTLALAEGIFPYDPQILARVTPSKVARFFYELSHLSIKEARKSIPQIKRHDLDWKDHYRQYLETHPEIIQRLKRGDGEKTKLLKLLLQPPEEILKAYGWALNHDNLAPMNIICTPFGQLVFIDWENISVSFGTSHFDEFWSRSFLLPAWQNKLLEERLAKELDKEKFLNVFYFALIFGNVGLGDYFGEMFATGNMSRNDYQLALLMWKDIMGKAIKALSKR